MEVGALGLRSRLGVLRLLAGELGAEDVPLDEDCKRAGTAETTPPGASTDTSTACFL